MQKEEMMRSSSDQPQDARFLTDFHEVAKIGATPAGGVERQAATDADRQTRDWFAAWANAEGLEVKVDAIGNMFACATLVPGAPYILVGSHLDSQPRGGRFDGAYGVIAALHAVSRVVQSVGAAEFTPTFNIAAVNWFNEEGGRFAPSIMGSSVYAGLFDIDEMHDVTDLSGDTVRGELDRIGYLGADTPPEAAGYAELHIEQGRILEREGIDIGIVKGSWYTQKLDIEVIGEQSHTGATAMADRRDALVAASKIVVAVHDVTAEFPAEALVSSVGQFIIEPNSPIVVARRAHLVADLRSEDPELVQAARDKIRARAAEIEREHGVTCNVQDFDVRPKNFFPEEGIALSAEVLDEQGFSHRQLYTMAGHDSVAMNKRVPSVMLFVPSVDGVSHCEREFTEDKDLVNGVHALTGVVTRMVQGELADERRWPAAAVQPAVLTQ